jgi:GntR family transcriptional regulator, transcriptional repressor for pyruvate dehydrogenase complex
MKKEFAQIRQSTIAEQVFERLHEWIMSGKLKPGDKLLSQDKLAEQFGVSRNTLREAIYRLTVMGLLTTKQGVGTIVKISGPSNYMTSLSDHILLHPATVREFIEARLVVEQATVRLAVVRMTQENVVKLNDLISQQTDAFKRGDIDTFVELDSEFHRELARASRNAVLLKFLETVRELLQNFIAEVSGLPGAIQSAIKYHNKIVEYMEVQDREKAENEMREHLYDVTKRIEKNMKIDLESKYLFEIN